MTTVDILTTVLRRLLRRGDHLGENE